MPTEDRNFPESAHLYFCCFHFDDVVDRDIHDRACVFFIEFTDVCIVCVSEGPDIRNDVIRYRALVLAYYTIATNVSYNAITIGPTPVSVRKAER